MRATVDSLLPRIPGPATARWPGGEPFARALAHGTMSVELFAPAGEDRQAPHAQDELYVILRGEAVLRVAGQPHPCAPGDALFVPAGVEHRFEGFGEGFLTWAIFWGPDGGEAE